MIHLDWEFLSMIATMLVAIGMGLVPVLMLVLVFYLLGAFAK